MQRIMNDPDNIVDEMLQGFLKTHSDLVERSENGRVVRSAHMEPGRTGGVAAAAISRLLSAMWAKGCVMRLPWVKFVPPPLPLHFWMPFTRRIAGRASLVCTGITPETI